MAIFMLPPRFDAVTAPEIEEKSLLLIARDKPEKFCFDFSDTIYISSAGLRVSLVIAKRMKAAGGECIFSNLSSEVYHIFKMAGFHAILNIEPPRN